MTRPTHELAPNQKTLIAIRHVPYQDLGILAPILESRGYQIVYLDAPTTDFVSFDSSDPDLLIVLGGPYDVGDQSAGFMSGEIEAVRNRVLLDRPTLGICLGSQILAAGLGARVLPLPSREIGWGTLTIEGAVPDNPLNALAAIDMLHWHGCGFDLPIGADRLASTLGCQNQAFMKGPRILGLQFHLEVCPRIGIETWIAEHPEDLRSAGIDGFALRRDTMSAAAQNRNGIARFLDGWLNAL